MKTLNHLLTCFLAIFTSTLLTISCDESTSTSSNNSEENTSVIVMLSNPTDQPLESRFYTHEGWFYKKTIPAKSSDTITIDADNYKVLTKDAAGEYLTHFPSSEDLSMAEQYTNIALDIDPEKNDTSLCYVFEANKYTTSDGGYPAMYFIDMTFDSTVIYAIGEHRWLYGGASIETAQDIQKAALASQKQGYPIVNKAFKGTMPNIIPKHTRNIGEELPESISAQYNIKGSVLRLYQVPEDKKGNIGNYIFNQVALEIFK